MCVFLILVRPLGHHVMTQSPKALGIDMHAFDPCGTISFIPIIKC